MTSSTVTPRASAASCSRRVAETSTPLAPASISPTTAVRPPVRKPSSIAHSTCAVALARTSSTRSGARPKLRRPGAYRAPVSCSVSERRHHRMSPAADSASACRRAASAAAKPTADPASPAGAVTSCRHPSGSPPHGKAASTAAVPKETVRVGTGASMARTRARRASRDGVACEDRGTGTAKGNRGVRGLFLFCSNYPRPQSQAGGPAPYSSPAASFGPPSASSTAATTSDRRNGLGNTRRAPSLSAISR